MGKRGLYCTVRLDRRLLIAALALVSAGFAALFTVSAAGTREGVDLPVVMYHSVLKDESRHGQYVISPAEFESDLRYLEDHGYTTILISDLVNYTKGGSLPEKPVLLTFDDGYYNNYLYAFETARRHGSKFVISPIGRYTDLYTESGEENAYYSHVSWEQLREMAESGLVEVENHSYDLHSTGKRLGARKLPGETEAEYAALLERDLLRAQEAIESHVGARPEAFVYPFGAVSASTPEIVKRLGFSCTLGCEEKISRVTRDPESLYGLGRYLRPSGVSSEQFFEREMGLK